MVDTEALRSLESFVIDNPELERLEELLAQFNLFEAIGAVRQELRHSDFLAFLLDPSANHGLGDLFAKRLLQRVLIATDRAEVPVSPIDFDVWSLDHASIHRERDNVDILLEDREHHLVVVVENKIDSSEHSQQLQRYRNLIGRKYPGWKALYLYLTPEGREPSDDVFIPVDYGLIGSIVEGLAGTRVSTLGTDVRTLMVHYAQILRRHIVSDSDIAELCRRIYQKHRKALDLIYEHRPDKQAMVRDVVESLINRTPELSLSQGDSKKTSIRFYPTEWDIPLLRKADGTGLILRFDFENIPNKLTLRLMIGRGPVEIRQALLDAAKAHSGILKPAKNLHRFWDTLYTRRFLEDKDLEDADSSEEVETLTRPRWDRFLQDDLTEIKRLMSAEQWREHVASAP